MTRGAMAQLARRAEASESLAFRRAGDLDRRGPPRNDLDATAASAAAAAAAAAETQKMLREVVASIVGMEYRATDAQGRTEARRASGWCGAGDGWLYTAHPPPQGKRERERQSHCERELRARASCSLVPKRFDTPEYV